MEPLNVEHAGRTLRGALHLPRQTPAPAIVLCHGFGGNRMEFASIFVQLAGRLTARGLAVCRFDFAGCGESDGDFADLTVSDQVAQVDAVLDRLDRHQAVLPGRLSLLGMSLGGLTASLAAGRSAVRSLALWAPAAVAAETTDRNDDWRWKEILDRGYADLGGKPIYAPFIEDAVEIDPFADAEGYSGPVLLASGTEDGLVTAKSLDGYRRIYGERLEEHPIEGVGHDFGTVEARRRLLDLTEEFVVRTA